MITLPPLSAHPRQIISLLSFHHYPPYSKETAINHTIVILRDLPLGYETILGGGVAETMFVNC
jgi:hypothetical protein